MKSPDARTNQGKPSKIVTSMHIYSTKNLRGGKINPEPTAPKQIQARRKKSNIKTGELFVEGQNIQRVFSGKISPTKDLVVQGSPSSSNLNVDSRRRQTNSSRQRAQEKEGVSAASLLFEEEKEKRSIKSASNKPRTPKLPSQPNPQRKVPSRQEQTFGQQGFHNKSSSNRVQKQSRYTYKPLDCPICGSASCECLHIGGNYKNCPHCRREEFSMPRSQTVADVSAVQHLQDRILHMLKNDFKQF